MIRHVKTARQDGPDEQRTPEQHPGHDENCRCKETSAMTPRELIKLMISDLAIWKKVKK